MHGNRDARRPWQKSPVSQTLPRSRQRNGNKRRARVNGRLEGPELKRAYAVFANKSALREKENRLALTQQSLYFADLPHPRPRIAAVESQMSHAVQKRPNERHATNFHFRNESVRHAQPQHQRQ